VQEYAIAKLDDKELKKAYIRVKKPKEQMTESDRSRSRERERNRRKSKSRSAPPSLPLWPCHSYCCAGKNKLLSPFSIRCPP
jgi:hypothetical protein